MNRTKLDEIAKALADRLRKSLCSGKPRLFTELLRLLANGRPVSPEQLGTAVHLSAADLTAALGRLPSIEFDREGNVVGSGLTLTPTPHHFQVGGHELFTWCALDTLFFPAILKQPARVQSRCPVSGVKVQLKVTPEGVELLEPTSAVVSLVIPEALEACCDVRGSFCNQVHFFSSAEVASRWLTEHPGPIILPVEDAYQLGRMLAEHLFPDHAAEHLS